MVVELGAVRVLAPSFGDSTPVWTNVIGVILLALALGAFCGGWCADRGMGRRLLPIVLWISGAVVCIVPFLAPRVAGWILPENLPLDRALPVLIEGSLAVGLLVFAPPILLLGGVSPVLIQLGSRGHPDRVGRVSGIVYASGTIGSLAGTFLATHVLVPRLGIANAFLIGGAVLVLAGGIAMFAFGLRGAVAFGLLFLAPAASRSVAAPPPIWLDDGDELLAVRDSSYQRLSVVETREQVAGRDRTVRLLKINEGLDSFHSVWIEGTPFTNGRYYDSFALLPFLLDSQRSAEPVRVLSLGCAAGSIIRLLGHVLQGRMRAVGVDLDPEVIALGRRWFPLPEGTRSAVRWVGGLDARVYVERADLQQEAFDLICIDTYRHQIYLPAHLASVEFFRAVEKRLRPGGIVALNVGDHAPDGPVLSAVAGTLAAVFPTVESFRIAGARNFLLFAHARPAGRLARRLREARRPGGFPEWLWAQALRPGACRTWEALPEGRRLTDARSGLDRLHERIYSRLYPRAGGN